MLCAIFLSRNTKTVLKVKGQAKISPNVISSGIHFNTYLHQVLSVSVQCFLVFTALHVMQTRYSDENSVCPSVCLSVCLSHA